MSAGGSRAPLVLGAFVAGLAGGLLAGLLAPPGKPRAVETPAASPGSPAATSTTDSQLTAAVRELREVLRALNETLAALELAPAAQAAPSTQTPPPSRAAVLGEPGATEDATLAESLRELSRALRSLPRADGAVDRSFEASLPPRHAVEPADRRAALAQLKLPAALYEDDDGRVYQETRRALRDHHLSWSSEDLVSAYGRPDELWFEGDVATWYYRLETERGYEGFGFSLKGGSVFSLDVEWEELDEQAVLDEFFEDF